MDQAWPGRVFRPAAQPQRHLEGVQHQLGGLVRGGGSADVDDAVTSCQQKIRQMGSNESGSSRYQDVHVVDLRRRKWPPQEPT